MASDDEVASKGVMDGGARQTPPEAFDGTAPTVGEVNLSSDHQLERGLKSRHIQFLALGGAIGTGLFVGSGDILATAGPAPLFMAYCSMMFVVYIVMNDLAEMVTYLPMKGISVPYFVGRFVDNSLAFAAGWNYWYAYAILVAAELSAGNILIEYWTTSVNPAVWITIQLAVILFLNIIAVSFFGEAEFWFASVKFITIIGLIITGIVIFFGGGPDQTQVLGFAYWENPGSFNPFPIEGPPGRFLGYWYAFAQAGFAFITSPELIALSAGETVAPRRNIPKAAGRFIYRLAIFYGLGSLIITIVCPYNDDRLGGASNAAASPFVIGIKRVGIQVLDHIINAAILTSAWSAGNAFCYSASRVLYSMALNKQAPAIFARTNKRGVPYVAVLFTCLFACLAYLNVSSSGAEVFGWFVNISTVSGYIAWIVVLITYLRFRSAMSYNGLLESLPYKTPFQPYASWFMLFLITLLTLTNGYYVFIPSRWSVSDFLAAYITIPIFLVLYLGHKLWFRGRIAHAIPDVDVYTGKKEMDELSAADEPPVPKNGWQKAWFWIA